MSRLHTAIAALMAGEIERRIDWDEQPELYRLYLADGLQPQLVLWETPPELWDAGPTGRGPAETLTRIAGQAALAAPFFQHHIEDGQHGELHGIGFRYEGWRGPEMLAADVAAGKIIPRPAESPDRTEVRMMSAVDRAGITYGALLNRGETRATTIVTYPGYKEIVASGAVFDALDLIVESLSGVPVTSTTRRP